MDEKSGLSKPNQLLWTALRLGSSILLLFGFALLVYLMSQQLAVAIGWCVVAILPFSLAALADTLFNLDHQRRRSGWLAFGVVILVAGGLAIALREGWVCVAMAAPLWLFFAALGIAASKIARAEFRAREQIRTLFFLLLPFAVLPLDNILPRSDETVVVTRSIIVDAAPEEIWPHLLKLDGVSQREGVWNVTQDILGVPKPSSAVVEGDGIGAKRLARWGEDIRFEEIVTDWRPASVLAWDFSFPDESLSRQVDAHISPDGEYLKISTGAYRLEALPSGATRLTLNTRYVVKTSLNAYAVPWGELMLGDIQTNILAIVKARAEQTANGPIIADRPTQTSQLRSN